MPWPEKVSGRVLACSGSLTIEQPLAAGAKLRLCWRRQLPDGSEFLSIELKPFASRRLGR
jgi:hypothetical protein